jgi:hypothetical protein
MASGPDRRRIPMAEGISGVAMAAMVSDIKSPQMAVVFLILSYPRLFFNAAAVAEGSKLC